MFRPIRGSILGATLAFIHLASTAIAAGPPAGAGAPVTELTAVRLADGATVPVLDGRVTDEAWIHVEPYRRLRRPIPSKALQPVSARKYG